MHTRVMAAHTAVAIAVLVVATALSQCNFTTCTACVNGGPCGWCERPDGPVCWVGSYDGPNLWNGERPSCSIAWTWYQSHCSMCYSYYPRCEMCVVSTGGCAWCDANQKCSPSYLNRTCTAGWHTNSLDCANSNAPTTTTAPLPTTTTTTSVPTTTTTTSVPTTTSIVSSTSTGQSSATAVTSSEVPSTTSNSPPHSSSTSDQTTSTATADTATSSSTSGTTGSDTTTTSTEVPSSTAVPCSQQQTCDDCIAFSVDGAECGWCDSTQKCASLADAASACSLSLTANASLCGTNGAAPPPSSSSSAAAWAVPTVLIILLAFGGGAGFLYYTQVYAAGRRNHGEARGELEIPLTEVVPYKPKRADESTLAESLSSTAAHKEVPEYTPPEKPTEEQRKDVMGEPTPDSAAEQSILKTQEEMTSARDHKAKEDADRKAKEEADRKAKEEADRKAKEEADRKAKEDADRKAKEDADRKAKEEADRKAKEDADRKAKEDADRKAKEDADRKAKEDADRKAKEDADRKAKEEADRKAKEEEVERRIAEMEAAEVNPKEDILADIEGTVPVGGAAPVGADIDLDILESIEEEPTPQQPLLVSSPSPPPLTQQEWKEVVEPTSGKKYYFNKTTKQTSWTKPAEFNAEQLSSSPLPVVVAHTTATNANPTEWECVRDAKTGKEYYFNKKTKQTSWTKPVAASAPPPLSTPFLEPCKASSTTLRRAEDDDEL